MTVWIENDTLFLRELAVGSKWANYVAERLNSVGVPCEATEMVFRNSISDIQSFSENDKDILLHRTPGYIDVKSRNLSFTSDPSSYPYSTAFVDTVNGWYQKKEKPVAVVLVSQKTSEMLVIPTTSEPYWNQELRHDYVRDIDDIFLTVSKEYLRSFDELAAHLKTHEVPSHSA